MEQIKFTTALPLEFAEKHLPKKREKAAK